MTTAQREEIEEIRMLRTIHQAYLTHPKLGGPEAQRVEHLLDIMERIAELQTLQPELIMDKPTLINWLNTLKQATLEEEKQAFLRQIEVGIKAETREQATAGILVLRERIDELRKQLLAENPASVN